MSNSLVDCFPPCWCTHMPFLAPYLYLPTTVGYKIFTQLIRSQSCPTIVQYCYFLNPILVMLANVYPLIPIPNFHYCFSRVWFLIGAWSKIFPQCSHNMMPLLRYLFFRCFSPSPLHSCPWWVTNWYSSSFYHMPLFYLLLDFY